MTSVKKKRAVTVGKNKNNFVVSLLKVALTFTLLFLLLYFVRFQKTLDRANSIGIVSVLGLLAILTMQQFISAFRWYLILRLMGEIYSPRVVVQIFLVAAVSNSLLLTSFAGLSMRTVLLTKLGTRLKNVIYSLGIEKFLTTFTLLVSLLLGVGVLALNEAVIPIGSYQFFIAFSAGALALLLAGFLFILKVKSDKVQELREIIHRATFKPRNFLIFMLLSAIIVGLGFACIAIIAHSLKVSVSLVSLVAAQPAIAIMTSIPLFMGGWGVREASMVLGLGLLGVNAGDSLAISLTYGILGSLTTFVAAGISFMFDFRLQQDLADRLD